jgi:hypothetical protein
MHHSYEIHFLKPDGSLSVLLWVNYPSDRQAIFSTRQWLGAGLPHASISSNGRQIAAMNWRAGHQELAV